MAISTYTQERRRINTNTMECSFRQFITATALTLGLWGHNNIELLPFRVRV